MSKKSKRAKQSKQTQQSRHMKQFQQRASVPSQLHEQGVHRAQYAKQQMLMGDFAGCISTCEPLLNFLPRRSVLRLEVLTLLGLAHGMLKQYQQSYDVFSEAIGIDPTVAELWHNRGLACHYMARPGEAVRNFERAVELSRHHSSEMTRKLVTELEVGRQELQEVMQLHETGITFEHYMQREERFTQA